MTNPNETNHVKTPIEKEIDELKQIISDSNTIRNELRGVAEKVLLDSPIVSFGKWLLGAVIAAGFAVWFGGVIYNGIQIKSLQDQSQAALQKMKDELKDQSAVVKTALDQAVKKIESYSAAAKVKHDEAVSNIDMQKTDATKKLAVDSLPDLSKLKVEIRALEDSGQRLNLRTFAALSHWSLWIIIGTSAVALVMSIVALLLARRS